MLRNRQVSPLSKVVIPTAEEHVPDELPVAKVGHLKPGVPGGPITEMPAEIYHRIVCAAVDAGVDREKIAATSGTFCLAASFTAPSDLRAGLVRLQRPERPDLSQINWRQMQHD